MSVFKKAAAVAAGTLFLLGSVAGPSQAKDNTTINDGLVNVTVGDVTVRDAVDLNVAASVAATVCALVDADVLVLAQQVDATGKKEVVCKTDAGAVKLVNNK
ncbi:hypothetical protein [Pseudarthrobacter sp. L1SW]|uniref:hypothetical protein n=1 Tax=Pseudarthrobacter sp. L1SW TaxID=2851598 RepID=UPI001E6519B4|nr:hypothetical protein [Pseudarthrobacter sp. L1SW]UEL28236.1 hypothetical protein KTR40_16975 [Pseudarthrobacter sp. L1SW]